jgi:SulP family sulfate permease
MILRLKYVPFIDSTAIVRFNDFIAQRQKQKAVVLLADVNVPVLHTLQKNKEFNQLIKKKDIFKTTKEALTHVEKNLHHLLLNGR